MNKDSNFKEKNRKLSDTKTEKISSFDYHGGNVIEEARRLGVEIDEVLDASASLIPFDPPHKLYKLLVRSLDNSSLKSYPDRTHHELCSAISSFHGIEPEMVLPGNGAAELFTWAGRDAKEKGLSAIPSPGFADYLRALNCWNASSIHIPLPLNWTSDKPQSFPISPKSEVIWITNPHNPTGQLWSRNSIENLLKNYELVICDEAFLPLVPYGEKESLLPLVPDNSNLIVIRSLTKLFNLAGIRFGYAVSAPDRLKKWAQWRDPWPVNGLAIASGTMLFKDHFLLNEWIRKIHEWVSSEGDLFQAELQKIPGIISHPSSANFLLIESDTSLVALRNKMLQKRILLRDCRSFQGLGERYLRISLQTKTNNNRIINALKHCLN